jgi:hypothetical protein
MTYAEQNLSIMDQLIEVLRSRIIGLNTVVIVCETITAEAHFNIWFGDVVKVKANEEELFYFLDRGDLREQCAAAIRELKQGQDLEKFHAAMRSMIDHWHALMNEFSGQIT